MRRAALAMALASIVVAGCSGHRVAGTVLLNPGSCNPLGNDLVATGSLQNPTALDEIVAISFGSSGAEYVVGPHATTAYRFVIAADTSGFVCHPTAKVDSSASVRPHEPGAPTTPPEVTVPSPPIS